MICFATSERFALKRQKHSEEDNDSDKKYLQNSREGQQTHVGGTRACKTKASASSAALKPLSMAAPLPNNASAVATGLLSSVPSPSPAAFDDMLFTQGLTPSLWSTGLSVERDSAAAAAAFPFICFPPPVMCLPPPVPFGNLFLFWPDPPLPLPLPPPPALVLPG